MMVDSPRREGYKKGMLRIGVISDTHLSDTGKSLAFLHDLAERYFRGTEAILHAGDIVAAGVLAAFAPRPVYAVRGNMDAACDGFPVKRIVEIGGCRIGLIHGWGAPEGLARRVLDEFRGAGLDCLVYGHSHVPLCQSHHGLLLFNPGSATDPRGMPYASVGVLEVDDGRVSGRIIPLNEASSG